MRKVYLPVKQQQQLRASPQYTLRHRADIRWNWSLVDGTATGATGLPLSWYIAYSTYCICWPAETISSGQANKLRWA